MWLPGKHFDDSAGGIFCFLLISCPCSMPVYMQLLDSVGCIKDIAKASTDTLIEAGLTEDDAEKVHDFFLGL